MHSSTSSENDTLQAVQEDSKEEDAINDDELQEENETKLSEYHAKNYFNSTMGGWMFGFFLPWQLDAKQETFPAIKILPFPSPKFITPR